MHGLPPGFDGAFLRGLVLQLLSFTQHILFLDFGEGVSITVEGAFSHKVSGSEDETPVQVLPVLESRLMRLLQRSVIDVHHDKDSTLTLVFQGGDVFKCYDSTETRVAYRIHHNGGDIVV